MKKLILLFLLFYSFAYSQVDTANWSFLPNQTNGKFTALISRELYYGISGGQYKQMSLSATSYDSTVFQLIPNQLDGKYTIIQNIVPYYGKDSGTVQMQLFNAPTTTNDTVTYVTKYTDTDINSAKTFNDSVTFTKANWQIGIVTIRPVLYQTYGDVGTPQVSFVGQVGVGEANWGLNLDYRDGLHNYFDSTRSQTYFTLNEEGFFWQRIPKGYSNVTSQPDAWAMSGNTTPMRVDTSGFAGFIGGITSIFKTKGNPSIGTSTANDYTDTTKYNFYGRGGKNYFQNKVGIGTPTPYSRLHLVGDAGSNHGAYNANADLIIDDAGTRALIQLINPISSYITFGDASTYNLGYIGYTNSSGILNINATTAVDINSIRENGTALTSKYSQLSASNTFTGTSNTFSNKVVVGTGTSNGTADFLVMGDTTTLRGTVYRDSSLFRVLVNPFSQRMKVEVLGKTGNNMLTVDSTLITSALAMTLTGDITSSENIFAGSNNKYIGWSSRSVLQSSADGTVDFFFNDGTTRATIDAGILRGRTTTPIATASTTGVAGTIIVGSDNYIYICTATNTWVRVLGLTW